MKNLPWPLGLEKRPVPLPSPRELKHHKSGRRPFAATLTVNAIYSTDISISDFIVPSPVAKITTKQSREQGKEETDKDQKETGSGGTIQGGRQTESPRSPFALNWSPPLEPSTSLQRSQLPEAHQGTGHRPRGGVSEA